MVQKVKTGRISGVLLPLFSLRSRTDFGIGDFGAIGGFLDWLRAGRQRMWMMLPLLPTAPGDTSPYATRSAFGLNPLFIHLDDLPEYAEAGGAASLSDGERKQLEEARASRRIRYDLVMPLKTAVLRRAFDRFFEREWSANSERARALRAYASAEADWLESYALFCALSDQHRQLGFWDWPEPLRDRRSKEVAAERERLGKDVLFHQWTQWVADTQWERVRAQARERGVLLCGDEPFIVGQNSADAWANPTLLRRDARLGVPPDAFSATGQDWGLPYFDFEAMEKDGYSWLRFRGKNAAEYFDLRRVDHAVGYFRQWIRDEKAPAGRFLPADEAKQKALGEKLFKLFLESGTGIVAEDLGVIPDWVRATLQQLGLPGYKVMRWERDEKMYRDPRKYPQISLVTTGTHDTETLKEWWETAKSGERAQVAEVYHELENATLTPAFTDTIHAGLLAAALGSASDLCVLPYQDVLGTADRINLPGSMDASNWSYRLDTPSEELTTAENTRHAARMLAALTEAGKR
ncbi:MAG TPA: 4-alpha-glucanotransferase [Myxococcales bacterium]|nr:4-alpha-glucanotransferase [Myxococcales bacterium]